MCTSQDPDRCVEGPHGHLRLGDEHRYFFAPWIGPKPKNVGDVLATVLENVQAKNSNLETFFNTPAVKLVHADGKVTGVIAKDESGKYIQFNASKGASSWLPATIRNNEAMVKRWCPDVTATTRSSTRRPATAIMGYRRRRWRMENLGHTKMMHDFDSGLMYEEPPVRQHGGQALLQRGHRLCLLRATSPHLPRHNGANGMPTTRTALWAGTARVYDSDYMSYANSPKPEQVMTKYPRCPGKNPQGVFTNLIDTYKADTIEELPPC